MPSTTGGMGWGVARAPQGTRPALCLPWPLPTPPLGFCSGLPLPGQQHPGFGFRRFIFSLALGFFGPDPAVLGATLCSVLGSHPRWCWGRRGRRCQGSNWGLMQSPCTARQAAPSPTTAADSCSEEALRAGRSFCLRFPRHGAPRLRRHFCPAGSEKREGLGSSLPSPPSFLLLRNSATVSEILCLNHQQGSLSRLHLPPLGLSDLIHRSRGIRKSPARLQETHHRGQLGARQQRVSQSPLDLLAPGASAHEPMSTPQTRQGRVSADSAPCLFLPEPSASGPGPR